MASNTNVLITGANRGLGLGLLKIYLSRPNHTVIAAVRNPSDSSSQNLKTLPTGKGSTLLVVKIDSASDTDPADAVATLKAVGITHLDIVIANAGIANIYARVEAIDLTKLRHMLEVNTLGPLKLYEAVYPLLKAASEKRGGSPPPQFIGISSTVGTTADAEQTNDYQIATYGVSKAALNHLVRRAMLENEWLNAYVVHPGFVQTDMGNIGAGLLGIEKASLTIEESVAGIVKIFDNVTREKIAGKDGYYQWDGTKLVY
ncbi:hypothetical protein B0H63DRAFT_30163 [Podospora didyma]|uniref:Aflatoxin biosynthesis ketoreductase nor-1 n=1 Tax=Podospora didyma TaxID=330526 RepID=A0AAE0P5Z2_9PEZI|nr:hypothetical protein B0H63DRAFT_30163 [Podospora didyma]